MKGSPLKELNVIDLLDRTGRLSYDEVVRVVRRTGRDTFAEQFAHPLLVGSSLYNGEFLDSGSVNTTTVVMHCPPLAMS